MIKVYIVEPVGFASNSYLLTEDGVHAVAIDPAQPRILDVARGYGLTVTSAVLTHGHFDHVGGCRVLQNEGVKVGCLKEELPVVTGRGNASALFGIKSDPVSPDFTFSDGDVLNLAVKLKVIATPGHTVGGCCFLVEYNLFSGDTLFAGAVGRCDLPTGDERMLEKSVKKLYALKGNYTVYTGHGEPTTLEWERKHNPYIRP